jgi:single-stranded DNA-specific DHH superfamily exonuclease
MAITLDTLLAPLMTAPWWSGAFDRYSRPLLAPHHLRPLVLYNADVDGFAASYFVYKFISSAHSKALPLQFQSRPVWNYEYDFRWVPDCVQQAKADLVVCVDIPIIQEPQILTEVAEHITTLIYDHHVLPFEPQGNPEKLVFLNSRALGGANEDHPASAFTAAAAIQRNALQLPDLLILATGLKGDWALDRYPLLVSKLNALFPGFVGNVQDRKAPLGALTSNINALFRAHPGKNFRNLQEQLSTFLTSQPPEQALAAFAHAFQLDAAARIVQDQVNIALTDLSANAHLKTTDGILIDVVKSSTFSVGILATVLAKRHVAPIVAIGYEAGDRVQFELRVAQDAKIDLTNLLRRQRAEFQPITSGGHPKAAGALVWKRDLQQFSNSLRNALNNSKTPAATETV